MNLASTTKGAFVVLGVLEFFNAVVNQQESASFLNYSFIGQACTSTPLQSQQFVQAYCWALVGLGLIRIAYVSDMNNRTVWLCNIFAHLFESFFWFQSASDPTGASSVITKLGHNPKLLGANLPGVFKALLSPNIIDFNLYAIYFIGPFLITVLLLLNKPTNPPLNDSHFLGTFVAVDEDGNEVDLDEEDIDAIEYEWVGERTLDEEVVERKTPTKRKTPTPKRATSQPRTPQEDYYNSLTQVELRQECKIRGIVQHGKKAVLVAKLSE